MVRGYRRKRHYTTPQRILLRLSAVGPNFDREAEAATQEGIAAAILSGRSTVTKWLARMVRRGQIRRERTRVNGHPLPKNVYRLTPAGSDEADALLKQLATDLVRVRFTETGMVSVPISEVPVLSSHAVDLVTAASLVREGRLDLMSPHGRVPSARSSQPWGGNLRHIDRLFGRTQELHRMDAWYSSRNPVLAVTGLPGIGKSALVAGWIQDRRPRARIFTSELRGTTTAAGLLADLGGFLRKVGVGAATPFPIPSSPKEASLVWRLLERDRKRLPFLLVLDNLDRASPELRRLVKESLLPLANRDLVRLVLISRKSPEAVFGNTRERGLVDILRIGGLDAASATALLSREGFPGSSAALRAAAVSARGHPLLLLLLAHGGPSMPKDPGRYFVSRIWRTLSRAERRTLEAACVFQKPIQPAALQKVSRAPLATVNLLETKSLLESTISGGVLVHDILRDSLLAQLAPRRFRELHRRASEWFLVQPEPSARWDGVCHLIAAGRAQQAAFLLDSSAAEFLDSIFVQDALDLVRRLEPTALDLTTACIFAEIHADCLRTVGHLGAAVLQYQHALLKCQRAGEEHRIPRILRKMAFIERCRNRCDKALGYLIEARARIGRLMNPKETAEILRETGLVEQALGELPRAAQHLSEAVDVATEASDLGSLARSLLALGSLEIQRGHREEGLEYNLEGLHVAERSGNLSERARAHIVVGTALGELGRFRESLEQHEKGLAVARLLGNLRLTAYGTMNRCAALLDLGRYLEAGVPLQEALELVEILEERDTLALLRIYEGQREMGLGRWSRAVRVWDRGLDELRKCAAPVDLARALKEVGGFHLAHGEVASGNTYLQEARAIARSSRNEPLLVEVDSLLDVSAVHEAPRPPS